MSAHLSVCLASLLPFSVSLLLCILTSVYLPSLPLAPSALCTSIYVWLGSVLICSQTLTCLRNPTPPTPPPAPDVSDPGPGVESEFRVSNKSRWDHCCWSLIIRWIFPNLLLHFQTLKVSSCLISEAFEESEKLYRTKTVTESHWKTMVEFRIFPLEGGVKAACIQ